MELINAFLVIDSEIVYIRIFILGMWNREIFFFSIEYNLVLFLFLTEPVSKVWWAV